MVQKSPYALLGDISYVYPDTDNFGWRDITGNVFVRGVAATDPAWAQIGSSPFYAYKFDIGDKVWFSYHVPHDIVPNQPIFFHAHWISDGTSTNAVTWQWQYMYAKGFDQANYAVAGTTITAEQAASGTAYRHMVTETDEVSISGLSEPDGIIYVCLTRVANTTSPQSNNANGIFLLTADIHYQSTDACTANKAPNFYSLP